MKDVIIAVNFSEASLNAARYTIGMLSGKTDTRVILYSMYEKDDESDTTCQYLETLKAEMTAKGVTNIELINEIGDDLVDSLSRLAHQKNAELIVMGITSKEEWKKYLFSSNSLKMAEQNIAPVLIIPGNARYSSINNIALASDFKNVEETTPQLAIKNVLELFSAKLHIVNVDSSHYVTLTEEYLTQRAKLQQIFAEFNPEFYFIGMNDFYEAIERFSKDYDIDLMIIIPKNHSFIDNLFSSSHTKKLAYNTTVPLLAAHQ
ncbi:MAG: universal stress protein [Chitinophagaceae bacterium]